MYIGTMIFVAVQFDVYMAYLFSLSPPLSFADRVYNLSVQSRDGSQLYPDLWPSNGDIIKANDLSHWGLFIRTYFPWSATVALCSAISFVVVLLVLLTSPPFDSIFLVLSQLLARIDQSASSSNPRFVERSFPICVFDL